MKKRSIFFLIIILLFNIPLIHSATEEGYGEGNDNLGQFVDSFENTDNITVMDDVIRNSTLNCIELNVTVQTTAIYNLTNLREHDFYGGAFIVQVVYSIDNNDELREWSSGVNRLGRGYIFLTVDSAWLDDKYVRFRWYPYISIGTAKQSEFQVWDGDYDRSDNTDFPSGSAFLSKGNGMLYRQQCLVANAWETLDNQVDTSGGSEGNVTLFFQIHDAWGDTTVGCWLDWIEINDGAGGADNIITINYNNSSPITMEQLGTEGDYGFSLSPELPFSVGGYEGDGYFITEDYLNYTTGNSLTLLTNSSIPYGTSLTVHFSNDNATWILNDWEPMFGGFEAIDLRDLDYSDIYFMYNFTGTPALTPRLYQSRLITTIGNVSILPCNMTTYNASSINVIVGTLNAGNLASTYFVDNDWYNVSEENAVPALDVRFNFTNVIGNVTCGCVEVFQTYTGHSHHEIEVQAYNFSSSSWFTIGLLLYNTTANWVCCGLGHNPNHWFSNGDMWCRFYHADQGHLAHAIHIDRIDLRVSYAEDCPFVSGNGGISSSGILIIIFLLLIGSILIYGVSRKR
ncbi:hypothetical protein ES702_00723 [subsurface metagenome]